MLKPCTPGALLRLSRPTPAFAPDTIERPITCVVYGMPREAALLGAVEEVLPLDRIAGAALRMGSRQ